MPQHLYQNLKVKGNQIDGLVRQYGDNITQLEDGTWEAEVVYICRWLNVMSLAPRRNHAQHPDFSTLKCNGCKIKRLKPGIVCELTVSYRGFFGPTDQTDESTEELASSMSEEPIETHPKFVTDIGGSKGSELHGAIFDDDGKFTGFAADSDYAGVESLLSPATIYRRTTPSRSRPTSVAGVGTVGATPVGADGGRNWLFISRTWTRSGAVYSVSEEYQLSGPGGWDPVIYS